MQQLESETFLNQQGIKRLKIWIFDNDVKLRIENMLNEFVSQI